MNAQEFAFFTSYFFCSKVARDKVYDTVYSKEGVV